MEITKVLKQNILAILHAVLIIIALSSWSIFDNHQKGATAIDIVCGMKVDKSEGYISKYKGTKYYFESYNCQKTFEMNPQKFIDNKCPEPPKKL